MLMFHDYDVMSPQALGWWQLQGHQSRVLHDKYHLMQHFKVCVCVCVHVRVHVRVRMRVCVCVCACVAFTYLHRSLIFNH